LGTCLPLRPMAERHSERPHGCGRHPAHADVVVKSAPRTLAHAPAALALCAQCIRPISCPYARECRWLRHTRWYYVAQPARPRARHPIAKSVGELKEQTENKGQSAPDEAPGATSGLCAQPAAPPTTLCGLATDLRSASSAPALSLYGVDVPSRALVGASLAATPAAVLGDEAAR
jgi:hypothetical protein